MTSEIVIVGGGVAGTSLAIRLARKGVHVTLVERDKLPRQKLCGEFVSPECLTAFRSLDVLDSIQEVNGEEIYETRFYSKSGRSLEISNNISFGGSHGALGVSRYELDFRLLQKARELGVQVLEGCRTTGIVIRQNRVDRIHCLDNLNRPFELRSNFFVDATGRQRVLGKLADKELGFASGNRKVQQVAFKTHFSDVRLSRGVCEMYFFRGGYGGLNYVENKTANHCFLIESKIAREFKGNADSILSEVIFENVRAREMMTGAKKKFDWLAVAVDTYGRQRQSIAENLVSVGDAGAFIDPFTGSGMLMALESASILAESLLTQRERLKFQDAAAIKKEYERKYRSSIRKRMVVCSVLRNLARSEAFVELAMLALESNRRFLKRLTTMTRPAGTL